MRRYNSMGELLAMQQKSLVTEVNIHCDSNS